MKTLRTGKMAGGFTAWDLLIVLAGVVLAAGFFWVWQGQQKRPLRATRICCVNNLKQAGLGFRMWASDHNDKFPWQVSSQEGGTLELANLAEAFRHFEVASNEFSSPKILVCPADRARTRATVWGNSNRSTGFTGNKNLSYFAGLSASSDEPSAILSGDRNISTNNRILTGLLALATNSPVRWTQDTHIGAGNIGLADGSAQQLTCGALTNLLRQQTNWPVRIVIP